MYESVTISGSSALLVEVTLLVERDCLVAECVKGGGSPDTVLYTGGKNKLLTPSVTNDLCPRFWTVLIIPVTVTHRDIDPHISSSH